MNRKRILKILDYVFLMRPTLFLPVWLMAMAGYRAAGGGNAPVHSIAYVLSLLTLMSGGVYILNQTGDTDSDRINKKLFLVYERYVHPLTAQLQAGLLIIIPLILGFLESPAIGSMFTGILALGFIYNLGWKNRAWGGLVLNVAAYGCLTYWVGWLCGAAPGPRMLVTSVPFWSAIGSAFLVTTLPDIKGDRRTGKNTFAVRYGEFPTLIAASALLAVTFIAAWVSGSAPLLLAAAFSAPFYILGLIGKGSTDPVRGIKVAMLVFAVRLCVWFPGLLIALAAGYALTRWYYQERFKIHYPYIFERIL